MTVHLTCWAGVVVLVKLKFVVIICTAKSKPEVGKVTLKSNGDEALSDEFL